MAGTTGVLQALKQIDDTLWELPASYKSGMRVPGRIFASERMMRQIAEDQSLEQVANVAHLPGIVGYSLAMPDIHWGYGFPIGGVAATRVPDGVISPGGVGFDINCGVRLIRTGLTEEKIKPVLEKLISKLYSSVPSGVGSEGMIRISGRDAEHVMVKGAGWAIERGYGVPEDLEVTEENGCMRDADPDVVGERPRKRGAEQIGTLGSGNHFLEVQVVETVYLPKAADAMGLTGPGQVVVMFHCGSRGFGHQICEDYVRLISGALPRYGISLPDRQLACAPINSPEGQKYLKAMRCAANFAWANRQAILHMTREAFERIFNTSWRDLGMWQVYDVSHNMAKIERHDVDGKQMTLCVHRKGATRAFPPGHPDVTEKYRALGQPVFIPGDMGRYSFVCVGGPESLKKAWGSACHGAGRVQSRAAAKRGLKGRDIRAELRDKGIIAMSRGWASLAEEATEAYKDVEEVVGTCERAGLVSRVARLRPLGVIKG
ncbi:MAG: RtcB family protein [Chloroflexi bacterium]|nr:RtcB family protein [Chloroflexota bacterium]